MFLQKKNSIFKSIIGLGSRNRTQCLNWVPTKLWNRGGHKSAVDYRETLCGEVHQRLQFWNPKVTPSQMLSPSWKSLMFGFPSAVSIIFIPIQQTDWSEMHKMIKDTKVKLMCWSSRNGKTAAFKRTKSPTPEAPKNPPNPQPWTPLKRKEPNCSRCFTISFCVRGRWSIPAACAARRSS